MNYNQMTKEKKAEVAKLLRYGWSVDNIAAYLDVTYVSVLRIKKENYSKRNKKRGGLS